MSKITCNVITDVLELYSDGVVSEDTRQLVDEHLANCAECSEKLKQIKQSLTITAETNTKPLKKIKKNIKKRLIIVSAVALAIALLSLSYVFISDYFRENEQGIIDELIGDGTLQAGKYYLYGNENSFYYEVFDDRTIELGGGDPLIFYVLYIQQGVTHEDPEDPMHEEWWDGLAKEAERMSKRQKYVAMTMLFPDNPLHMVALGADTIEGMYENENGFRFLRYKDEETLLIGEDIAFIRID